MKLRKGKSRHGEIVYIHCEDIKFMLLQPKLKSFTLVLINGIGKLRKLRKKIISIKKIISNKIPMVFYLKCKFVFSLLNKFR